MNVLEKLDALLNGPTAPVNAVRPPARTVVEYPGQHVPAATGPAVERAVFVPDGVNPGYEGASRNGTLDGSDPTPGPPLPPEAQRELHPKIRKPLPPDALSGVPFASPETTAAVCAAACTAPVLTPEEKAKLAVVDAKWMRLNDALVEQLRVTANQRYARHLEQVADKIAEGQPGETLEGWTREDWQQDHAEKVSALKRPMHQLEREAWATVQPAFQRVAVEIDDFVDGLEAQERDTAAHLALPYSPSATVLRLRKVAQTFATADHSGVGRPASMVDALPR